MGEYQVPETEEVVNSPKSESYGGRSTNRSDVYANLETGLCSRCYCFAVSIE
jgi:hypothetical protein